ncbi:MAG: Methyltransferase protein [Caulobacteraceae bacterium]|nr:Methyltransferase protein [Caulobacteraceae bacterium]
MAVLDPWYIENLVCPVDRSPLSFDGQALVSGTGRRYPVIDGLPVMLLSDERQTIGVARASLRRAQGDVSVIDARAPEFYLESLGISDEEKAGLVAFAKSGDHGIDPVVAFIIGATSGYAYAGLIGGEGLDDYPIPEIRVPDGHGKRLLDIGCNWGRWSIAAARKGYEVVGIDPALGAVMAARRIARRMGLDIRHVVADGRFLPFKDASFDAAYSYSVLQHFARKDAEATLAGVGRVLRPGGLAVIQMAAKYGLRSLQHQAGRGFREPQAFEVRYWSPSQLRAAFEQLIGPSRLRADCYFGLGWQWSDRRFMSGKLKVVLTASEALRRLSDAVPPLRQVADSLFCFAEKPAG